MKFDEDYPKDKTYICAPSCGSLNPCFRLGPDNEIIYECKNGLENEDRRLMAIGYGLKVIATNGRHNG